MEHIITDSPFQPGAPVNPQNFKGRQEIIQDINRYMASSRKGVVEHFYITGKRGMGKTSLTNYIIDYYEKNFNAIGVHVVNDGIHDIETLLQAIIEELLNKNKNDAWYKKLYDGIKDEIDTIGILGNTIKFRPSTETIDVLRTHFATFLTQLSDASPEKNFIIVIDDVNGLSQTPYFANWYKSLADTLALKDHYGKTNVSFILTSYPDKLNKLHEHNPSFSRIFHHYHLGELSKQEINEFYKDNFNSVGVKTYTYSLSLMNYYCSGMPTMMQEIGDAVFWLLNSSRIITKEIVLKGVLIAGNNIGRKYLKPEIDMKIRSGNYRKIFEKISEKIIGEDTDKFIKSDISEILTDDEKGSLDGFLSKAQKLKIIEQEDNHKPGEYVFSNKLYPIYFLIQKTINDEEKLL